MKAIEPNSVSQQPDNDSGKNKNMDRVRFLKTLPVLLIVPISVLFMELISKLQVFGEVFDDKIVYLFLLASAMSFLLGAFPMLLPGKHCRRAFRLLLGVLAVLFTVQVVYFNIFHTFCSWNNLGEAGGATRFWREALITACEVWYMIAALFLPLVLFCVFGKKLIPDQSRAGLPLAAISVLLFLSLYLPSLFLIGRSKAKGMVGTPYYHYTYIQNDLDKTFQYYGILNATRLDIKQLLFGEPEEDVEDLTAFLRNGEKVSATDTEDGWNKMEIDFDSLKKDAAYASMDAYFSSLQPTRKNKYTGYFKGKNLIVVTIESFCSQAIDKEFTPLLYQMSTEGFIFNNFYNPLWGGSTASGEYAILTGNFSPSTNCLGASTKTYQPFALGNQFSRIGYQTLAYHNFTGYFYNRDESHPNFGYTFKSLDSGLKLKTSSWPNSDLEMAEATVDDYCGLDKPFHVYYMTMSGHMKYNFTTNGMAYRHRNDLPEKFKQLNEEVQAYYACQYEVELMLRKIVDELKKHGKLEDTVFAMSADHYPYAMGNKGLAQLYGLNSSDIRHNFDLYRSSFILWNAAMPQPITVDTPCSSVDIMPTLANMFGLEYDSRLIMGKDIMSDGEHFAPLKLAGWSWVSEQGKYKAYHNEFIPAPGCTLSKAEQEEYVAHMNQLVAAKTAYSKMILDKDYYRHVFLS